MVPGLHSRRWHRVHILMARNRRWERVSLAVKGMNIVMPWGWL